jgi:hypothetical protein
VTILRDLTPATVISTIARVTRRTSYGHTVEHHSTITTNIVSASLETASTGGLPRYRRVGAAGARKNVEAGAELLKEAKDR